MAVLGGRATAQLRAVLHLGDVVHVDRHAFTAGQHDVADLLQVGDLAGNADQELLAVAFDVAGADVLVVGLHRLCHVLQREAQRAQACRIRRDVHLTLEATDGVDLGHAGHVAQLRPDHPVLQGAQVGGGVRRAIGLARLGIGVDGVHEDLAEAGRDRAQLRIQAVGNLRFDLLQAFGDLLAGEVDVGAVLEDHGHLREPVARQRAGLLHRRQAGHHRLHRVGDALFGFQRRVTGGRGIDLHLDVGDVRGGIDRQLGEAPAADDDQHQRQGHHQPAMGDGGAEDALKHGSALRVRGAATHQCSCDAPALPMSALTT